MKPLLFFLFPAVLVWSCAPNTENLSTDITSPVNYEMDTLKRQHFCENSEESCVSVELRYLRFVDPTPQSDKIAASLNEELLKSNATGIETYSSYEAVADSFIAEYIQSRKDQPDLLSQWEMLQDLKVEINNGVLLGLRSRHFHFSGGAHGNIYLNAHLYQLSDGERLALKNLLEPGALKKISLMAETQFREERTLPAGVALKDYGYWFNQGFYLPEVFYYNREGITFVYNVYQIAPYSEGVTYLKLPYTKIDTLIREEYRLIDAETS